MFTKGDWEIYKGERSLDEALAFDCQIVIKQNGGYHLIANQVDIDDAHLIAAAPAMYEALKQALVSIEASNSIRSNLFMVRLNMVKKAIAKAEGKE